MKSGIMVALCLLTVLGGPVFAQGEGELLDDVQTALDHFNQQIHYRISGLQSMQQTVAITTEEAAVSIEQTVEQRYNGALNRDESAEITIEQQIQMTNGAGEPLNFSQTLGIVIIGDVLYLRVSDVQPTDVAALLPEGWINVTENPAAFPGSEMMSSDQYLSLFANAINYSLTTDMLLSIEELAGEEIDGQTLRVIEITFDPALLFASGALDSILNAYDYAMLGLDNEALADAVSQNARITTTLWLTAEGNLYRADSAIVFAGTVNNAEIDSQISSSFVYTDFGVTIPIEAPTG